MTTHSHSTSRYPMTLSPCSLQCLFCTWTRSTGLISTLSLRLSFRSIATNPLTTATPSFHRPMKTCISKITILQVCIILFCLPPATSSLSAERAWETQALRVTPESSTASSISHYTAQLHYWYGKIVVLCSSGAECGGSSVSLSLLKPSETDIELDAGLQLRSKLDCFYS